MSEHVVIDCSRAGRPDQDYADRLYAEAIAQAKLANGRGDPGALERAANISRQADEVQASVAEGPVEERVPLTPEDIAQRAKDAEAAVEMAWTQLRAERNARLAATDWTQLADAPISAEQKAAYDAHRQALRDLPAKVADPMNPAWPAPPGAQRP